MNITKALDLIREVINERADDREDWDRVVEAWAHVESHATPRNTINAIINELQDVEQCLAERVVDKQDEAEEQGYFTPGMFTGDNDDIPVCVPEDAAPYLDAARHQVREAIESLQEEQS